MCVEARAVGLCSGIFIKSTVSTTSNTVFHNREVKNLFEDGVTTKTLERATDLLTKNGTFDIPVTESGFVAAANVGNHHGGYGRFLWFRDFARVQQGLSDLPHLLKNTNHSLTEEKAIDAAKVRDAQLSLLADPKWTELAVKNIEDSSAHIDPANGFRSVIWIRRLLDPFVEKREASKEEVELESRWGHKQNDALAVFANSFFDILQKNEMRAADIPKAARVNMMLLTAYFVRLKYWKMWDVGAWEEGMGRRTSSIAMVTSFLERYAKGINDVKKSPANELDVFFNQLRENGSDLLAKNLSPNATAQTQAWLQPQRIESAIDRAYELIRARVLHPKAPVVESKTNAPNETRFEDSALFHIFWHPLARLNARENQLLLKRLSVLERESGYIRYKDDWFLYGSAQVALNHENLKNFGELAVPNSNGGFRKALPNEILEIIDAYNVKNMERVVEITGKDLEAQWTLPDSYLTQIYADAYIKTRKPEYLEQATKHFLRVSGLITGKGEFNSEGHPVEAWRLPEAYVPANFIKADGTLQTVYLVSPNSPLNWSIAEYIMALNKMREAISISESN